MAQDVCEEEIYRCVESHEPTIPAQICVKQGDLVKVVNKHSNGWWDVCTLNKENKDIKSLPATKLEREPQQSVTQSKSPTKQLRRNTIDDLEHDYYDLTDGVKNKISASSAISSVPIGTRPSPLPYLTPIPNVSPPPPPPLPPKTDKFLSENQVTRTKTSPKIMQFRETRCEIPDTNKSKTLSPNPVKSYDKFSVSTIVSSQKITFNESSSYTKTKKKSISDNGDKPCVLSRLNTKLSTLSSDNAKLARGNSFVSYIAEDEKENVFASKLDDPRLERINSSGLKKTLSREGKITWSTLGKQEGFFGSLSKERAEEMLKQNKINGEYLIRSSTTREDAIALCVYHAGIFSNEKFITGDPPMEFTDFADIVSYYKENPLEFGSNREDIILNQPILMKRQK